MVTNLTNASVRGSLFQTRTAIVTRIRFTDVMLTVDATVADPATAPISVCLVKTGSSIHTGIRETNAPFFTRYTFVSNRTSTFVSPSSSFCACCTIFAGIWKTEIDFFAVFSLVTLSTCTFKSFSFIDTRTCASISARIWMTFVLFFTVLSSVSFSACAFVTLSYVIASASVFARAGLTLTSQFTMRSHKSW